VGRSINPALHKGQIEGAYIQGMGWLTIEECIWDKKGKLLTHGRRPTRSRWLAMCPNTSM